MMKSFSRLWNSLPLFWKTFALAMILAASVVAIGEGMDGWGKRLIRHYDLPIKSNVREFFFWLTAIVVSSLAGSFLLSRIITGALTRIRPVVECLSLGDLGSRILAPDSDRGDEIGDLSRSFNRMADNITQLLENERTLMRDISHELRSPLTRMKLTLSLLEQDAHPSPAVEGDIKQLSRDIDLMESMVGQMLERARQETLNKTGLEKTHLDLASLIAQSVERQTVSAAAENKTIRFEGPETAPYQGNAALLRRLADNLLKNAWHYTAPKTEVVVQLRALPQALILEVSDQGPGVPEEHLENIFRPFFRVDSARARKSGGFGLGLAIAAQAARLHGGQLTALNLPCGPDSRPGGLKMRLTLPLVTEEAAGSSDL